MSEKEVKVLSNNSNSPEVRTVALFSKHELPVYHRSSLGSRLLPLPHRAHTPLPSHTAVWAQSCSLAPPPPQSHSPCTCTDSSCEWSHSKPRPGPEDYPRYLCTLDRSEPSQHADDCVLAQLARSITYSPIFITKACNCSLAHRIGPL